MSQETKVPDKFADLDRRIEAAIRRIPDRLSTPEGELVRLDWACTFALNLGGELAPVRHFAFLPFHLHLLTDPVLMRLRTGYLLLDHPQTVDLFDWAFEMDSPCQRAQIVDVAHWWSLYDNRYPRLIVVPDRGESLLVAELLTRLTNQGWHGPYESPPTWEFAPGSSSRDPLRSLVRVERPVDPAWFEQF